ncbi:MAG: Nif3-like dinuclear metal center hexameric protein [Coriobacteriia bacterium]|nr:Nif3-like dinuclear metal center hexameric protein [Coriobacteriia bacterium]
MTSERAETVGDLVDALERRFPSAWAEEWDRVGLIAGERHSPVEGVLVTLDATAESVTRAAATGAQVLVTHHPPYLNAPEAVVSGPGPAGTLEAALRLGVAVVSLHTNLDRAPEGASALASALGLTELEPVEPASEPVALIVTYVPPDSVEMVTSAMTGAGASRMIAPGDCTFARHDVRNLAGITDAGARNGAGEVRVEVVAPLSASASVLAAARCAHPARKEAVIACEGVRARGVARLGRVCKWRAGGVLSEFADHVSGTLGGRCRVWGDPMASIGRVAVVNGSAGSLMQYAVSAADTLIAGEVRYHDALAAAAAGLKIVEAGHDSTEWPLVSVIGTAVRQCMADTTAVTVEAARAGWWTTGDTHVRG